MDAIMIHSQMDVQTLLCHQHFNFFSTFLSFSILLRCDQSVLASEVKPVCTGWCAVSTALLAGHSSLLGWEVQASHSILHSPQDVTTSASLPRSLAIQLQGKKRVLSPNGELLTEIDMTSSAIGTLV